MARSSRQPGRRSRAARRAGSPSLNLDKSLKIVKPPPESIDHRPSILAIHHGAGITKKSKRKDHLSAKKRKRQERGVARAELATDKLEIKVAKSIGKGKTIKGRRATWEELNSTLSTMANIRGRTEVQEQDSGDAEMQPRMEEVETSGEIPTEQRNVTSAIEKVGDLSLTAEDEEEEIL